MSRSERRLTSWLLATGVVYAAGAVDFVVRPRAALVTLGQLGGEPLEEETPGLYNSLASAYMATIAALALGTAADPSERRELIPPLLVAKATSSGVLLYQYLRTRRRGFAIASALDALLFGVTAGLASNLD